MAFKIKQFWKNKEVGGKDGSLNTNVNTTKLETDEEKRERIRSLWVINIQTFIFALSFSIVITGVLPYLRQVSFLNQLFTMNPSP